ncbi:MAG: hypothetical protein A2887_06640 [Alphaproteobacteria bacterium RIFCSPLOWO2_01_FULL_40_26]|nr:MAG: hypothetical protein A3D15_04060 [Alphaproteobacteria bacterium RIFCSPHIGHO2_02_FULL_40_34]OFW94096.1 MAG: hypothetical protein A2887_06640 [Alphaproteobacteria bacterium RIFCSPLOWO2_01_FULL_40_26]OFX11143.1 MAG: hypothetical protein A3G22_02315 [Alphaproteobacteria bacterium RIFCSPLOWO2_12_FULL_40_11]
MEKFIKLSNQERKNVIQKAAFDLGLRFDVVEKDIWVCFVLEPVFKLITARFSTNFGSFSGKIFCSMPDTAAKFC